MKFSTIQVGFLALATTAIAFKYCASSDYYCSKTAMENRDFSPLIYPHSQILTQPHTGYTEDELETKARSKGYGKGDLNKYLFH